MRLFKRTLNGSPLTHEYRGIETTTEGNFHTLTAHVVGPRELPNPDMNPDYTGPHLGSEELFTHDPAHVSKVEYASQGDLYGPLEKVRVDATKMHGKVLSGRGGSTAHTSVSSIPPTPVSSDEMTLTELDPDVEEINPVRQSHSLIQKLRSGATMPNKLSGQFYQPRLPGM